MAHGNKFVQELIKVNEHNHSQAVGFILGIEWASKQVVEWPEGMERDCVELMREWVALAKEHIVWEFPKITPPYDQDKDV